MIILVILLLSCINLCVFIPPAARPCYLKKCPGCNYVLVVGLFSDLYANPLSINSFVINGSFFASSSVEIFIFYFFSLT